MTDLAGFLLARIAEDEAVARAAEHADGPETMEWRRGGKRVHRFDNDRTETYESVFAGSWDRILVARDDVRGGPVADHIARWDPARVLAECEAKRRIVADCVAMFDRDRDGYGIDRGIDLAEDALRLLAAPYAGHDAYRAEWRP